MASANIGYIGQTKKDVLATCTILTQTEMTFAVTEKGEKMQIKHIFPIILIALQLLAGICYIPSGDWRMVVYWLAAAVLNVAVTF